MNASIPAMPRFRRFGGLLGLLFLTGLCSVDAPAQTITYEFSGGQVATIGDDRYYEFDVTARGSEAIPLAGAEVFVSYNADLFGSNAWDEGAVRVTLGDAFQGSSYSVTPDDDNGRLRFWVGYGGSAAGATDVPTGSAVTLLSIGLQVRAASSGTFPVGLRLEASGNEQFMFNASGFPTMIPTVVATDTDNSSVTVSGTSLPVELTAFDAVRSGSDVVLRWATATEQHNAGFHVEHAAPAEGEAPRFEAITFVPGAGTTTEPQRYTHAVAGLTPGRHVFRLRQVDVDGGFEYSPEVAIEVVPEALTLSEPYPNPFNPQTQFAVTLPQTQRLRVSVYNVLGQRVAVLFDGVAEAGRTERLRFDASAFPSGTYLITAVAETSTLSKTVTLLK